MIRDLNLIPPAPEKNAILELAMRCCVLGKDTLLLFSIRTEQSTRCGGIASRSQKSALRWCGLTDAEILLRANEYKAGNRLQRRLKSTREKEREIRRPKVDLH